MKIHHIGYLIRNMERSVCSFEKLGFHRSAPIVYDKGRDAELCFMVCSGYCVELVEI